MVCLAVVALALGDRYGYKKTWATIPIELTLEV